VPAFGSRGVVVGVGFTSVRETVGVVPAGTGCPAISGVSRGMALEAVDGIPGTETVLGIGTEPLGEGPRVALCGTRAPCGAVLTVSVLMGVVAAAGTVPLAVPRAAPVVADKLS
jgi:hypothetical protein